ncbi:hypothetical protein [Foetidibacter luteolus]|uniref:hypothetical protein n=1 Tax=Foetidibacter luteolus TaxID=2608880 RepID=UPI00129A7953|nr:hypothetical protein [Foetidibacter luteolus]
MLPAEIQYLLDNYDAEDINLSINKADYSGETPLIGLTVHETDAPPQTWTLEIIGHRASELSFTFYITDTTILITDDHPLLWQYSDFQSELYFNGSSTDIYKIVSELNQIDFELFGKYQNPSEQLYVLLRTSNGSLGKGSKKLLTKYAECLNRNGIKTSMVGGYSPSYFDGKNTMQGETLKIFLFGGSYIVGQDFIFSKST